VTAVMHTAQSKMQRSQPYQGAQRCSRLRLGLRVHCLDFGPHTGRLLRRPVRHNSVVVDEARLEVTNPKEKRLPDARHPGLTNRSPSCLMLCETFPEVGAM
jgi:hypothetical protein